MSLAVHRPARPVSSLLAEDPVELAADLPRLPSGAAHVARLLGVHVTDLHKALEHRGLEVPKLRQPAETLTDPVAAREAYVLVEQVGWVKAAQQLHMHRRTLRAAFQQWGLGEPAPPAGPCAPSRVADRFR
jgi:hypothetical protein